MEISIKKAEKFVVQSLKAGLCPMLHSSPGIGKSDLARKIANDFNLELIDVRLSQMDPTEIQGYPVFENGKASYVPMDLFPIEGTPIPEGKRGWLIFFDELNSAVPSTIAAAYKLILDKMVGKYKLHKKAVMMAAGNLATDRAVVNRVSTAMQSRLVHFTLKISHRDWLDWAYNNEIDGRITSFINFRPDLLHKFDPKHNDNTFACPRSWSFTDKLISSIDKLTVDHTALIAACVSEGVAREFISYTNIFSDLPHLDSILANPDTVNIPDEPAVLYAFTGLISNNVDESNFSKLFIFIKRLPIEFQLICMRFIFSKFPQIDAIDEVNEWKIKNVASLV